MRTTLEIDDDLYRRIKAKAALEGRKVTELVEQGLLAVLDGLTSPNNTLHRIKLPLIEGGHPAAPGQEMTPERTADILQEQEVERHRDAVRS